MKNLTKKLVRIQGSLKAPKNQRNNFGNYNYRSCEDILEAVKPLLAKEELLLTITDSIAPEPLFVNAVAEITDGVDKIQVRAQAGINLNRKGMDVAQCYGASSSYARKYALNGLFLIDDTKDADSTNTHGKGDKSTEKSWLNKGTAEFKKVQTYLKGGGSISKVEEKYRLSKEVKELLTK